MENKDLAASATFVAEPEETGAMQKPPIDPKMKFLNKPMLRRLFLGAISLVIEVTATFLFAWYTTSDITYARTVAFAVWMFGHIFLALNFRSKSEPLLKKGYFQTKSCFFGR
jgi:Ca2+-transporting ATPase